MVDDCVVEVVMEEHRRQALRVLVVAKWRCAALGMKSDREVMVVVKKRKRERMEDPVDGVKMVMKEARKESCCRLQDQRCGDSNVLILVMMRMCLIVVLGGENEVKE